MKGEIKEISYSEAVDFLLPRHYSGRKPNISKSFGWFFDNKLKAVLTFGKPASPYLCMGVLGKEFSSNVYELNRLCRDEDFKEPLSYFVSRCIRSVSVFDWCIVSYADTGITHVGYIYQACNFIYTGMTKERTDKYTEGNKHSRHYKDSDIGLRKVRTSKHRYIYFATNNKKLKKLWFKCLRYSIELYPKGKSLKYKLGEYLEPKVIKTE